MINYKVTNITSSLNKRDLLYNSVLEIDYIDRLEKKTYKLRPNETVYMTFDSLPTSLHKLRMKKLAIVVEVSDDVIIEESNKAKISNNSVVKNEQINNIENNTIIEKKPTKRK